MASAISTPELLNLVTTHVRQGIVVYDAREKVLLINSRVSEIFGFPYSAVSTGSTLSGYLACVGKAVGWSTDQTTNVIQNHRKWAEEGKSRCFDHNFEDGKVLEIGFSPIERGGAVLTFTDVTQERNLQTVTERRETLTREAAMMLERVGSIATQHRIVAFNARIEAARIGDDGRGLIVVADEVRDLSRQMSDVLHDISRIIDASLRTM